MVAPHVGTPARPRKPTRLSKPRTSRWLCQLFSLHVGVHPVRSSFRLTPLPFLSCYPGTNPTQERLRGPLHLFCWGFGLFLRCSSQEDHFGLHYQVTLQLPVCFGQRIPCSSFPPELAWTTPGIKQSYRLFSHTMDTVSREVPREVGLGFPLVLLRIPPPSK